MTIEMLPNTERIKQALIDNDGYCPCKVLRNEDTKCVCKEFRLQDIGICSCGLYIKRGDYILYTKDGCPRCAMLKQELKKHDKTYIELHVSPDETDEFILKEGLPVLLTPMGIYYNYKDSMNLLNKKHLL